MTEDRAEYIVIGEVTDVRPQRNPKVRNFSVKTEVRDRTIWTQVACWDELMEQAEHLEPGTRVKVVGYPKVSTWQDKDGNTRSNVDCVALSLEELSTTTKKTATKGKTKKRAEVEDSDDLPF